jgi:peptide/nickel transport system permease protein
MTVLAVLIRRAGEAALLLAGIAAAGAWLGGAAPVPEALARLAAGDLGESALLGRPVAAALAERAPETAQLLAAGAGLALLVGVPLGRAAAARPGGTAGRLARAAGTLSLLLPVFLLAVALALVSGGTVTLPGGETARPAAFAPPGAALDARALALPAAALALAALPAVTHLAARAFAEAGAAPWLAAQRAAGLGGRGLAGAARGRLLPALARRAGALVAAALVVEAVLGRPGLGPLLLAGAGAGDTALVTGCLLAAAALAMAGAALADMIGAPAARTVRAAGAAP